MVSPDLAERMRALGARRVGGGAAGPGTAPGRPVRRPRSAAARQGRALGVPDGAVLLVTVARLAPQKGLPVLADALADAAPGPARTCAVVAVVAGDGPLAAAPGGRPAGAATRSRCGCSVRREDVADLLAAADVLVVVPSLWEGQSLAVQEALRAGAADRRHRRRRHRQRSPATRARAGAARVIPRRWPRRSPGLLDDAGPAGELAAQARARVAGPPAADGDADAGAPRARDRRHRRPAAGPVRHVAACPGETPPH